jgi:hypothetical protein
LNDLGELTGHLSRTNDDIDNRLNYRYNQNYTFSILALLYPNLDFRNRFHIDHIHPRSLFTKAKLLNRGIPEDEVDFYLQNVDALPNLQLLEGIPNQEKSSAAFVIWLDKYFTSAEARNDYMK